MQEAKRVQLEAQQEELVSQKGSLSATKSAKSDLLVKTKAQESSYQKIIAQKKAQELEFESTLNDLQSKLKAVKCVSDYYRRQGDSFLAA